jgi:hypothetical protein
MDSLRHSWCGYFHLSWFGPHVSESNWPRGGWSVYQIDSDKIADSIGTFETLSEVMAAIEAKSTERSGYRSA